MSLYGQTLLSVFLTPFHLLSRMTCNLILIFLSGIIATTFNNFTHFLHQPGDMLYCSLSFFYFRPDIGFHFIPEVTGIQTEFSNIILVSFIALCILLSLFCQSDVRNKMWCDFGRIASIMIVTKVLLYCSSYAVGISRMDDTSTRSSPSLQTLCNELSANRLDGNFHSSGTYSIPFFFKLLYSQLFGKSYNCGDLIYSGHTAFITIIALLSFDLFKKSHRIIKYCLLCYSMNRCLWGLFCFFSISLFSYYCIAARKHYTGIFVLL